MDNSSKCVGFVGLGLIGGSIAKAIHKFFPDWKIIAYNRNPEVTAQALQDGVIHGVAADIDSSFSICDIIFL